MLRLVRCAAVIASAVLFAPIHSALAQDRLLLDGPGIKVSFDRKNRKQELVIQVVKLRRIRIGTRGVTAIELALRDSIGAAVDLSKHNGSISSPDLVNQVIECELAPGAYRVIVQPSSLGAVGELQVFANSLGPAVEAPLKRRVTAKLRIQAGHTKPILCSDMAENVGVALTGADDYSFLWSLRNGRELRQFQRAYACYISPDGVYALVADNEYLSVFNGVTDKMLWRQKYDKSGLPIWVGILLSKEGQINSLAMVTGELDKEGQGLRVKTHNANKLHFLKWDGANPSRQRLREHFLGDVTSICENAGQLWFGGRDGKVRVFAPKEFKLIERFRAGTNPIAALQVDGDKASWVDAKTADIWVKDRNEPPKRIANLIDATERPRPQLLMGGGEFGPLDLWTPQQLGGDGGITQQLMIEQIRWSGDKQVLLSADSNGRLHSWPVDSGKPTKVFESKVPESLPPLAVSRTGKSYLLGSGLFVVGSEPVAAKRGGNVFRSLGKSEVAQARQNLQRRLAIEDDAVSAPVSRQYTPDVELVGNAATKIRSLQFDAESSTLDIALDDETVRRWDLVTGAHTTDDAQFTGGREFIRLKDGEYLVTDSNEIRHYAPRAGPAVYRPQAVNGANASKGAIVGVGYARHSNLVCFAFDRQLHLVDVKKKASRLLYSHTARVTAARVSRNGGWVVVGDDSGGLIAVSVETGKVVRTFPIAGPSVRALVLLNESNAESESTPAPEAAADIDIAAMYSDDRIVIWESERETQLEELADQQSTKLPQKSMGAMTAMPGGTRLIAGNGRGQILIHDLKERRSTMVTSGPWGITQMIAFEVDGDLAANKTIAAIGTNKGQCSLWEFTSEPKMLCHLVGIRRKTDEFGRLERERWRPYKLAAAEPAMAKDVQPQIKGEAGYFVYDNESRFDTDMLEESLGVHWIFSDAPFEPGSPALFQREFYEPNLLSRKLAGEDFAETPDIGALDRIQPVVAIREISERADGLVDVAVSVKAGKINRSNPAKSEGMPFDLRLFRDGQLVRQFPDPTAPDELGAAISFGRSSQSKTKWQETYQLALDATDDLEDWDKDTRDSDAYVRWFRGIPLPRVARNESNPVEFSAYAFNKDRVRSEISREFIATAGGDTDRKRRAYIISVGVNAHETPSWDLRFAANDAIQFNRIMAERLAPDEFEVISIPLVADYKEPVSEKRLRISTATKDNIRIILQALGSSDGSQKWRRDLDLLPGDAKKIEPASPDDLLLIFLAGHGFTTKAGDFYFFPHDIGVGQGRFVTEDILKNAVSSTELWHWMHRIDAGRTVMFIDACQSGGVTNGVKFGPFGSRGLGQLAYDKQMQMLAASQTNQVAIELEQARHGLMTYALLHVALASSEVASGGATRLVTAMAYVRDNISSIYQGLIRDSGAATTAGAATEKTAKIVVLEDGTGGLESRSLNRSERLDRRGLQKPVLFNFYRGNIEILLIPPPESMP